MANTRMSAKNSFQEGLILDISPENMSATSMSSALNATLLTFNGNEMVLQNDMGNGRVETAFLPEGYVPVGSCEFGDIIYIVSYNPIINKSQIGCFPSPERNISSDEIGDMGQVLSWEDFQKTDDGNNPNGKLKASSVKKILFDSRDMTPGDKYIIYSEDLKDNNQYLSDYGNIDHEHGRFPKLVKVHVVSIEESGKIVYLDSTTKWYDTNHYYLNADIEITGGVKDLDSYRTLVSSAYSVFSSKVSGKLALLVELEKITGFSCSWVPYSEQKDQNNINYHIYWNFGWTTNNNNINPNGAMLIESEWTGPEKGKGGQYREWEIQTDSTGKQYCTLKNNYKDLLGKESYLQPYETTITRHYEPEKPVSYNDFLNKFEYNKYLNTTLSDKFKSGVPYKVNIDKVNINTKEAFVYPRVGYYYINCSKVIDNVPYYYNTAGDLQVSTSVVINDDIINNYFHYPIIKKFREFNIPVKQNIGGEDRELDISNLVYRYKIAPTMPYGILEEFAQEGYIDFSKIGKKSIFLNTWKYYNYENTMTLTWGMEAYTEPNKGISEVVFEFYDNQGFVGAYHNKGKLSYNGQFTEYITLGSSGSNYKFNNIPAFPEYTTLDDITIPKPQYHKGLQVKGDSVVDGITYLDSSGNVVTSFSDSEVYYQDDSATLYPNWLYLVKIITKYCDKNVLDEYIEPEENDTTKVLVEYRWLWTNTLFNEYYYQSKDFKELQFNLGFDCTVGFKQNDNFKIETSDYVSPDNFDTPYDITSYYKSISAKVQSINQDGEQDNNLGMTIRGGLYKNYNTFNIEQKKLSEIKVDIYLADDKIINYPETPALVFSEDSIQGTYEGIQPVLESPPTGTLTEKTSEVFNELVKSKVVGEGTEIWSSDKAYQNYKNNFTLSIKGSKTTDNFSYITDEGEKKLIPNEYIQHSTNLADIGYDELEGNHKYVNMTLTGIHLSKYCYLNNKNDTCPVLRPFVRNISDLTPYKLAYKTTGGVNQIYYTSMLMISLTDATSSGSTYYQTNIVNFSEEFTATSNEQLTPISVGEYEQDKDDNTSVQNGLRANIDAIKNNFKFLFPIGYGYRKKIINGPDKEYSASPAKLNGNILISTNREIANVYYGYNSSIGAMDLGGTLAGISGNTVQPGDHHSNSNTLLLFTPYVMAYLTQLYYKTEKSGVNMYVPSNYIYLEPNYTIYKRNIVVKLDTAASNDLLVMSTCKYQDYLDSLLGNNSIEIYESAGKSNVTVKFEKCIKTQPLELKFDYIEPLVYNFENMITYVDSVYSDTPTKIQQNFDENTIYYWNGKTFVPVNGVQRLKRFGKFEINSDNNIVAEYITEYDFSIERIGTSRLLEIGEDNGVKVLQFRNLPSGQGGTYSMMTHDASQGDRYLTEYQSNLFYFKT